MRSYSEIMSKAQAEMAKELKRTRLKQQSIMNLAITSLKDELFLGLLNCSESEQLTFKKMYSGGDLSKSLEQIIYDLDQAKLEWAMGEVGRTLAKKETQDD